jgi:hypothetical protein
LFWGDLSGVDLSWSGFAVNIEKVTEKYFLAIATGGWFSSEICNPFKINVLQILFLLVNHDYVGCGRGRGRRGERVKLWVTWVQRSVELIQDR